MTNVLSTEYLQLEGRSGTQSDLGRYYFDLRPDLIEDTVVFAFKVSECRGQGSSPTPPGWVGQYPAEEYEEPVTPSPLIVPVEDSDDRPAGLPLRVSVDLPFLDPRYGDAYVVFVLPAPEEG